MKTILAIDIGTSSIKTALLDPSGRVIEGPLRQKYPLQHPTPEAAEIDPTIFWSALGEAIRHFASSGKPISGIGLSCLTPALVLLERKDQPLRPIWIHLDRRARASSLAVEREVGPEFLRSVGCRPLPGGISALCYRELCRESPDLPSRVGSYLHLNGWLGFRLTGEKVFDPANASFTGLYDTMGERKWSPRWCRYFGVDPVTLPRVVSGNTVIGGLRASVAGELGLPAGLEVRIGTADTTSALLAAELGEGDVLHSVGTTQVLAARVARPEPAACRLVREVGVGDGYLHVTHNPVGGAALEWIRKLCFGERSRADFYAEDLPAALTRETPTRLDPPFLGGDRLEIEDRSASLHDLTLWTQREDLLAAVLSAMRAGHRKALRDLGLPGKPGKWVITGGGAGPVLQILGESWPVMDEASLRGVAKLW
jgi:xylulokinase